MSAKVTKVAITRIYAEIRTSLGIKRLQVDTSMLEEQITKNVAALMANAFATLLVTASAGHKPSICIRTGFSFQMPRKIS